MQVPQFVDGQFVNGALLNIAENIHSASAQSVVTAQTNFGLVSPASLAFTFSNSLNVTLTAGAAFRLITSSGAVASALGTASGTTSNTYPLSFASVVPSSGSVTAYVVASVVQIGQSPVPVIGPPIGHPDYNPANAPFVFYLNSEYSIAFTVTTTAPDNVAFYEVARTTVTSGQSAVTSLSTSNALYATPAQITIPFNGNPNGNLAGTAGNFLAGVQPTLVWDTADHLLWICTTSGTAATAVWSCSVGNDKGAVLLAASTTLNMFQAGAYIVATQAGITITLPSSSGQGGYKFKIANQSGGTITVASTAPGDILVLGSSGMASISIPAFGILDFESDTLNWNIVYSAFGNSNLVYNVANAAASTNAVPLGQAQTLFAGVATVGNDKTKQAINTSLTLPISQAGSFFEVTLSNITVTLPSPIGASASKYRIFNSSGGSYTLVTGAGGSIVFPGTLGSGSITVAASTFIEVESDGTNWIVTSYNLGNSAVPYNVANATAPTNAVPLGQIPSLTTGRLLNIRYITTTTTYTPTTGTTSIVVELQAPGGASGGAPATNSGQNSSGGGGGSGAWARKRITSGFSGATVTIGAPGIGSPGAPGTSGSAVSFGSIFNVNGGNGGQTAGPSGTNTIFLAQPGLGGTAGTSGDLNVAGLAGAIGLVVDAQGIDMPQVAGMYAGSYGTGGAPVFAPVSSPAVAGTNGQPGLCVIWEFS